MTSRWKHSPNLNLCAAPIINWFVLCWMIPQFSTFIPNCSLIDSDSSKREKLIMPFCLWQYVVAISGNWYYLISNFSSASPDPRCKLNPQFYPRPRTSSSRGYTSKPSPHFLCVGWPVSLPKQQVGLWHFMNPAIICLVGSNKKIKPCSWSDICSSDSKNL